MRSTLSEMINAMLNKPKVYDNNANHPGHTTSGLNKMKVPIGNADRPAPLQPGNAPPPEQPPPNPLTPLGD